VNIGPEAVKLLCDGSAASAAAGNRNSRVRKRCGEAGDDCAGPIPRKIANERFAKILYPDQSLTDAFCRCREETSRNRDRRCQSVFIWEILSRGGRSLRCSVSDVLRIAKRVRKVIRIRESLRKRSLAICCGIDRAIVNLHHRIVFSDARVPIPAAAECCATSASSFTASGPNFTQHVVVK